MIALHQVSLQYTQGGATYQALQDINLTIAAGESLAIVGLSGSGKTSLLNVIAGLVVPDRGQVTFCGEPVGGPRKEIAIVFQDYGLFPWKTVGENMTLPLTLAKVPPQEQAARLTEMLDGLGIAAQVDKYPFQLSGGEQQRVAIGRALIAAPQVLLMDEPFSALDPLRREQLQNTVKALCDKHHLTLVFVTHNIVEALRLADRIAVFDGAGKSIQTILANTPPLPGEAVDYAQAMLLEQLLKGGVDHA